MQNVDVSVIVPVFNEGPTFDKSLEKIVRELNNLKRGWEIIFVEDKSSDDTRVKVERWSKKLTNSQVVYHSRNMGRGKSVADGIKIAKGSICGYLDVDLEVSEKYVPLFIEEVEGGNDLVVGKRFYEGGLKSFSRFIASKAYALIVRLFLKVPIDDTEAGYKFFNRAKRSE